MENTILVGDHLLVQCFPKPSPERGDIIVFRYPLDTSESYVKRVMGVPGDHIHLEEKAFVLNGKKLVEPYARHIRPYVIPYADNFPSIQPGPDISYRERKRAQAMFSQHVVNGELVVPEGFYFVMGDNRDNSLDSRYWGFVPRDNIIGEPLLIYESEEQKADGKPAWPRRIRWSRFLKKLL
jgi:signal peptidase I